MAGRSLLQDHKIKCHTDLAPRVFQFVVAGYWSIVSTVVGMGTSGSPEYRARRRAREQQRRQRAQRTPTAVRSEPKPAGADGPERWTAATTCGWCGGPITPRSPFRALRGAARKAGLPQAGLHTLHHSVASVMLTRGVPLKVVSEILGHSSIAITGHLRPRLPRRRPSGHVDARRRLRPVADEPPRLRSRSLCVTGGPVARTVHASIRRPRQRTCANSG